MVVVGGVGGGLRWGFIISTLALDGLCSLIFSRDSIIDIES